MSWETKQETRRLRRRVGDDVLVNLEPMGVLAKDVKGGSAELGVLAGDADGLCEGEDETGAQEDRGEGGVVGRQGDLGGEDGGDVSDLGDGRMELLLQGRESGVLQERGRGGVGTELAQPPLIHKY